MNKAFNARLFENRPSTNTPLGESMLNPIVRAVDEIDNRVVLHDTTKASQADMLTTIVNVSFNENTGVFTFTRKNGTTITLDTKLEKMILNWNYDKDKQILYLILSDGTEMPIDLSSLISQYEFIDSHTIRWVINSGGKVSGEIIAGSITSEMLEPNYLANVQLYASQSLSSANTARDYADNASLSAQQAKSNADLAKTYSDGAIDAVKEINKKLNIAEFEVNKEGYLIYNDDASYNFAVDDNGYLNWEVK